MSEAKETLRTEHVQIRLEVSEMPDTEQPHRPTHAPVVPDRVTVEYRRLNGGPWECCMLQVAGRKRLQGGGTTDQAGSALVYRNRAGIVEVPHERWPQWLQDLVREQRPLD